MSALSVAALFSIFTELARVICSAQITYKFSTSSVPLFLARNTSISPTFNPSRLNCILEVLFEMVRGLVMLFRFHDHSLCAGILKESGLKEGLIVAINRLLQPVRDHFENDENAKSILAQVMAWKKENLVPPTGLRRLQVTVRVQTQLSRKSTSEFTRHDKVAKGSHCSAICALFLVVSRNSKQGSTIYYCRLC